VFGALSLLVASRRDNLWHLVVASLLLAAAILSLHFTAMTGMAFLPDPTRDVDAISLSPASLSFVVAGGAGIILALCLVAALTDRRSKDKLRQQKVLLDAALENMSQGLCMFDADGCAILFNERYVQMMKSSAATLKGQCLLDLFRLRKASGEFVGDPEGFFAEVMADIRAGKRSTKIVQSARGRVLRVMEQPMQGGGWVATFEDITDWQNAQAQISHMARHDALTNLPNRTLFREQLERALRRAKPNDHIARSRSFQGYQRFPRSSDWRRSIERCRNPPDRLRSRRRHRLQIGRRRVCDCAGMQRPAVISDEPCKSSYRSSRRAL
jgi:PAS domain-containing protein